MRLQLAIQGGGAKIAALLAAGAAVQDYKEQIELSRVVGTSAGAIVACMLAAKIDLSDFRLRLQQGLGKQLVQSFPKPTMARAVTKLAVGRSIWDEEPLRKLLADEFGRRGVVYLKDMKRQFGTEVIVLSTNLRESRAVPASEDDRIVDALLDSCGLPFLFRTWADDRVDGGIAENFGWKELEAQAAQYGPIIGIMFKFRAPANQPKTLRAFGAALLDTAMTSATEKARISLGPERIFEIDTELDTFDFETALNRGLSDAFVNVRQQAVDWLGAFLEDPDAPNGDVWSENSVPTMLKIGEMYRKQHAQDPLKYVRCVMEVFAHGLKDEALSDVVQYETTFRTLAEPIYCHGIAFSQTEKPTGFRRANWNLFDHSLKEKIAVSYLPTMRQVPSGREVLIFFDRKLPANSGPYALRVTDSVEQLTRQLKQEKRDQLTIRPSRTDRDIDQIDVVLHLPATEAYKNTFLTSRGGAAPGRAMNDWELREYTRNTPLGFRTVGWTGINVPSGYMFGPDAVL